MNDFGSETASASVAVEGPPEPPSGRPSVSLGNDRVSLAWCGPPYDGGCMITGFILELQEEEDDWIPHTTVVNSLSYTVKDLVPGSLYRFRVRAENIHGLSEASSPSEDVRISLGSASMPRRRSSDATIQDPAPNKFTIKPGGDFKTRFIMQEELGKGRFGVVFKVVERDSGQTLAAKIVKCIKAKDKLLIQDEIAIMRSLQHPKLLQLAAAFESPREIVMVMEYITGGELFERVVADDFTLTEHDCILFMRQICEGVDYMHSKSVVHLDLKPENIMCHNRTSHRIKIIDFGLAQRITTGTPIRVLFGTPEFIPPEIINYEPIGFQSDMWSVGVICYVLLSGLSPFMGDSDVDTFANITRADYDFDDDAFDAVTQDAKDFISSLLVHRKESRLTAKQCLDCSWLTQPGESLINVKICTDKLKKFIIRRKWQKTGNAIRALGRMATLCANARRITAAVASAASTPVSIIKPSTAILAPPPNSDSSTSTVTRMASLNEEETIDRFDDNGPIQDHHKNSEPDNRIKNKTCSERSDSGFSESPCTSCAASNSTCTCAAAGTNSQITTEHTNGNSASPDNFNTKKYSSVLDIKLNKIISDAQQESSELDGVIEPKHCETKELKVELPLPEVNDSNNNIGNGEIYSPTTMALPSIDFSPTRKSSLSRSFSASSAESKVSPTTERDPLIMRSDFTNTITMRKQSLEINRNKDKSVVSRSTKVDVAGKVYKMKQRFSQENLASVSNGSPISASSSSAATVSMSSSITNKHSMDFRNVFERFNNLSGPAAGARTSTTLPRTGNRFQIGSSSTLIRSPKFQLADGQEQPAPSSFDRSTVRLSGRVKTTTDRLPSSSSSVTMEPTLSSSCERSRVDDRKGGKRSINKNTSNFQKASAFWRT